MLSNKPYLIRAFYQWIADSGCTPFLVVNAEYPRCKVPQQWVENGEITLNISPDAIRDLKMGNDSVDFCASFSGVVHIISIPVKAVLAIYAQENQQGMFFDYEESIDEGTPEANDFQPAPSANATPPSGSSKDRSHLRLVDE